MKTLVCWSSLKNCGFEAIFEYDEHIFALYLKNINFSCDLHNICQLYNARIPVLKLFTAHEEGHGFVDDKEEGRGIGNNSKFIDMNLFILMYKK